MADYQTFILYSSRENSGTGYKATKKWASPSGVNIS